MKIKNKIIKTEPVKWRDLRWLQAELKEMTVECMQRLKKSLIDNGFSMPFHVWDTGKEIYILDGHHRQRVLQKIEKDGHTIPEMLPANFIQCKDKKQAAKMVLVFSSIYAKITDEGLYQHLEEFGIKFEDVKLELDLPEIDLKEFNQSYFQDINLESAGYKIQYNVVVELKSEEEQENLYNKLKKGGYKCRVLTL